MEYQKSASQLIKLDSSNQDKVITCAKFNNIIDSMFLSGYSDGLLVLNDLWINSNPIKTQTSLKVESQMTDFKDIF